MTMKELKTKTLVLGSGVGGLGAGCWLKYLGVHDFKIVDKCTEVPKNLHNGVHYLHSVPSLPFVMDFKKVTLTDGVLRTDGVTNQVSIGHTPNLIDMLKYSEKVREIQHPSSIMEVGKRDSVFLPKSNTLNEMIEQMEDYIGKDKFFLNAKFKTINLEQKFIEVLDGEIDEVVRIYYDNVISTLPLSTVQKYFGYEFELGANPVHICNSVANKIVPNWMINLYVPNGDTPMYRVSILNNVVSIESTHLMDNNEIKHAIDLLNKMFHVEYTAQAYTWETGKVMSIATDDREKIVEDMKEKDFYSIGRFGLWNRKLLVDSTINQAEGVVKYITHTKSWDAVKNTLIN